MHNGGTTKLHSAGREDKAAQPAHAELLICRRADHLIKDFIVADLDFESFWTLLGAIVSLIG
jgi:hypothetical protein